MSDLESKLEAVVLHPGRASCFLHRHLSWMHGYEVLALDVLTREPSVVAVQPMDRLQVWEVLGPATGDAEERKRGPRCELAAEYRGTFDFETKAFNGWQLVRECPAPRQLAREESTPEVVAPASPAPRRDSTRSRGRRAAP